MECKLQETGTVNGGLLPPAVPRPSWATAPTRTHWSIAEHTLLGLQGFAVRPVEELAPE